MLLLSFYEERPAEEVGAQLGLSAGNVRVTRHRGIGRLRACVEAGRSAIGHCTFHHSAAADDAADA